MNLQIISAFTPSMMSETELEQIFVQREDLAKKLLKDIVTSATKPAKHYNLLIGARGMGKTHLAALIYYRLLKEMKEDANLKKRLAVAWLQEEEWGVDSWLDLVFRILCALEEREATSWAGNLQKLSIEKAKASATTFLLNALYGRNLVLIGENLDDLFQGLGDAGQQEFKSFLKEKKCCTILATTPTVFPDIEDPSKPFAGFFNPIYLPDFSVEEAVDMLQKIAQLRGQEELARFLPTAVGRSRIRAVNHLAGGNVRIYILFSQFITQESLDELGQSFMKMLDDLTPFYQSQMKALSNQQRKIIDFLARKKHPVAVKDIATGCFIEPGTAGSQLRNLRNMGFVEALQDGRESGYELKEVLMRLCLEVKNKKEKWVEILIDFLRIWYPPEERKGQLEIMRGKSRLVSDDELERAFLSDLDPVFSSCQRDLEKALQAGWEELALATLEELSATGRIGKVDYDYISELVRSKQYTKAKESWESILSRDTSSAASSSKRLQAYLFLLSEDWVAGLSACDELLAEDDTDDEVWHLRGYSLGNLGRYEEAIASYDKALAIKPDFHAAWYNRGYSLGNLGRYEEAIASYDKALAIKPDFHEAWNMRGISLFYLERHEEAIASYEKAIAIKPDKYNSWHDKGLVRFVMGDYAASLTTWRRTFEIVGNSSRHIYDVVSLIQEAIEEIIPRFAFDAVRSFLRELVPIYQENSVIVELSTVLVRTLPKILDPKVSDATADEWLAEWKSLLGEVPEMQMAFRLMDVAISYKKTPQQKNHLWLKLAKEERSILDDALGM